MNVLVVGGDTKGAWQMRGVQLGRALLARVTATPTDRDWAWADLIVLVKRAAIVWQKEARHARARKVWDALDFWKQPLENQDTRDQFIYRAKAIIEDARIDTVIGATRAMGDDIGGVYLPHHCQTGLVPQPFRQKVEAVGYIGQKKYLGRWATWLERACAEIGLRFLVNPPSAGDVDVLVSFRDGRWDGWVCRQWKSGVKHVNAMVAGRPILCQPSAAYDELLPVGATIDTPEQLADALEYLSRKDIRENAWLRARHVAAEFTVEAVAAQYFALLQTVARRAA